MVVSPRSPPSPRRSYSFSDFCRSTTVFSFESPRLLSKCSTSSVLTLPTVRSTLKLSENSSTSEDTQRSTDSESPSPTTKSSRSSSVNSVSSVCPLPLFPHIKTNNQVWRTWFTRSLLADPTSRRLPPTFGPSSSPTPLVDGGLESSLATSRVVMPETGSSTCPSWSTRWSKLLALYV